MRFYATAALAAALAATGAGAQAPHPGPPAPPSPPAPPPFSVHDIRPAFVPLVAAPVDLTQPSDPIWTTGSQPAKRVIARFTLRALETAVVDAPPGGTGKKMLLLRAYAGDPIQFPSASDTVSRGLPRLYCADAPGAAAGDLRLRCYEDRDGDGAFETSLPGVAEWGDKAEQLSLLGKAEPLAAPLRYRAARAEEQFQLTGILSSCGKGHDEPRYDFRIEQSAAQLAEAAGPLHALAGLGTLPARAFASCRTSEKVRSGDALFPATLEKGAALVRLDELVIRIAPKEAGSRVTLLGLRNPDRLYRADYTALVPVSDSTSEKQRALAIAHKFDRPVLMATGRFDVAEGPRGPGDTVLTVGFRHGYMGVLSEDTKIRTLLSSRSLPAGTLLYGIPMSTRRVQTYGGVPLSSKPETAPDPDDVNLTWCVPIEEEAKWTATCLPSQNGERYTLLKGQTPAFEVTSMRYVAGTTTNPGSAPVTITPAAAFERPLAWRFILKTVTEFEIALTQETLYGDAVVHSREQHFMRAKGAKSGLIVGDGVISFADGPDGKLVVRREKAPTPEGDTTIRTGLLNMKALEADAAPR